VKNVHPRNEGTSQADLALLFMMPAVIVALLALITYVAIDSLHMAQ
jgi:hypothetical protein